MQMDKRMNGQTGHPCNNCEK